MGAFKKGQALFLYFMAYAVIGWIYEVFLEVVVYRWGFSNRGFYLDHICRFMVLVLSLFCWCYSH